MFLRDHSYKLWPLERRLTCHSSCTPLRLHKDHCIILEFSYFMLKKKTKKNYVPSLKKKYTKSGSSKDPTKLGLLRYVESNCGVLRGSRYMIGSTPWKYKHQQQRSDNCRVNISIRQSSIIPTAGIIKITIKADSTLRQSNPQREKSSADG